MKIIDCTIRDGGLLNNWCFSDAVVKASYFAAERAGVDYFEIGYKNDPAKEGLGVYGYCDNKTISNLFSGSPKLKLLCMIDAGKYTGYDICDRANPANPFSGIRVASYPHEVELAVKLIEMLSTKGYEVFLQLMSVSEWKDDDFKVLNNWENKNILEAVYFADSFGSFIPSDIPYFVEKLRSLGFKAIGFHPHNNLQMAFANALQAIQSGATYVDATIYGMGRGSGNLPIEIILSYFYKNGQKKYNAVPYLDVIERFYINLMKEYQWGYSLKSLFGGIKNIHPYYIAELFKQGFYTVDEIWNLLDSIKNTCSISFSRDDLKNTLENRFYVPTLTQAQEVVAEIAKQTKVIPAEDAFSLDSLSLEDKYKNKKFVIIANGPSVSKYTEEIKNFIQNEDVVTIGCNYLGDIYSPDYHVFVSKKRFLKYANTINEKSVLIVPSFFGKKLVKDNYNRAIEYIEMVSTDDLNSKPIEDIKQRFVYPNVAMSAVLSAYQMGASEIMVVGMDGYENENSKEQVYFYNEDNTRDDKITASIRYDNLAKELKRIGDFLNEQGVPFSIITPTSHKKYFNNVLSI